MKIDLFSYFNPRTSKKNQSNRKFILVFFVLFLIFSFQNCSKTSLNPYYQKQLAQTIQPCIGSSCKTILADCFFNGSAIPDGRSVKAYQSITSTSQQECVFENRLCKNGSLSGFYTFDTCRADGLGVGSTSSTSLEKAIVTPSGPADWNLILSRSCNLDGLLWGAGTDGPGIDTNLAERLADLSCYRLSRVIETWASIPDVEKVKSSLDILKTAIVKKGLSGKKLILGIFVAEAINYTQKFNTTSGTVTNVTSWCQPGSIGQWGPNTCVPNILNQNFQTHLKILLTKLIPLGVTDIHFGQLDCLDPTHQMGIFIQDLRNLGLSLGATLIVGGQPNNQYSAQYMSSFDYVVGPTALDSVGNFNQQAIPMSPDPHNPGGLQVNIWSSTFLSRVSGVPVPKVLVEIDWSSDHDDAHYFAGLLPARRWDIAFDTYSYLSSKNMGWIFPILMPLNDGVKKYSGACFGQNQWSYSDVLGPIGAASDSYTCKGAPVWEKLMTGIFVPSTAQDQNLHLVQQVYWTFLGRSPDAAGQAYYLNLLATGTTAKDFTEQIQTSTEAYVVSLYQKYLNRNPDGVEDRYWITKIDNGGFTKANVDSQFANCKLQCH